MAILCKHIGLHRFHVHLLLIKIIARFDVVPAKPVVLVTEGDSAVLRVWYSTIYLNTKINIKWFLGAKNESNRVLSSTRVTLMENNAVLRIDGVTGHDVGSYVISVVLTRRGNNNITEETSIKLDILGKFRYYWAANKLVINKILLFSF